MEGSYAASFLDSALRYFNSVSVLTMVRVVVKHSQEIKKPLIKNAKRTKNKG